MAESDGIYSNGSLPVTPLSLFLVQVMVILSVTRLTSCIFSPLCLPVVVFEIISGILFGPSGFGQISGFTSTLFPSHSLDNLSVVANFGLIIYMFLIGLELNPKLLMSQASATLIIASCSMILPFGLGLGISRYLYSALQGHTETLKSFPYVFGIFVGTAMSITAFPVLARILKEDGLIYTKAGVMVMGAAAFNDAVAWCLLVLAISIGNSTSAASAGLVLMSLCGLGLFLIIIVRPLLASLIDWLEGKKSIIIDGNIFAMTLVMMVFLAWTTQILGVDAIFGGFLFGLIIPRNTRLYHTCTSNLEELTLVALLPLYFTLSGLNTNLGSLHDQGGVVVLVIIVASAGKILGAGIPAYFLGNFSVAESAAIAFLMNTRGLVELIVLNIGLKVGIFNSETFSVMIIMCLVTTIITCPLVECIYPKNQRKKLDEGPPRPTSRLPSSISLESSSIYKHNFRIMSIIDTPSSLPLVTNVLFMYSPLQSPSTLSTCSVKLVFPTQTQLDELLLPDPITGRVIKVENIEWDSGDMANLIPLDLAMLGSFSQVICSNHRDDVKMTCLRLTGDPYEFSFEIKRLCIENRTDTILLPWKVGHVGHEGHEGLDGGGVGGVGNRKVRMAILRSLLQPSSRSSFDVLLMIPKCQHSVDSESKEEDEEMGVMNDANDFNEGIEESKDAKKELIVVFISGVPGDEALLSTTLRYAQRPNVTIEVLVPGDLHPLVPSKPSSIYKTTGNIFRRKSTSSNSLKSSHQGERDRDSNAEGSEQASSNNATCTSAPPTPPVETATPRWSFPGTTFTRSHGTNANNAGSSPAPPRSPPPPIPPPPPLPTSPCPLQCALKSALLSFISASASFENISVIRLPCSSKDGKSLVDCARSKATSVNDCVYFMCSYVPPNLSPPPPPSPPSPPSPPPPTSHSPPSPLSPPSPSAPQSSSSSTLPPTTLESVIDTLPITPSMPGSEMPLSIATGSTDRSMLSRAHHATDILPSPSSRRSNMSSKVLDMQEYEELGLIGSAVWSAFDSLLPFPLLILHSHKLA